MNSEHQIREEIVRRLAPMRPQLVLLFGSRATGTARPDSDYDLLVVAEGPRNPVERIATARRLLRGLGVSVDVLVYTPSEWARHRNAKPSLAHVAWTTGQVLHAA